MHTGSESVVVLGLMSGTSLDGLDICRVRFSRSGHAYTYEIEAAVTLPYSAEWKEKLLTAEKCVGAELMALHKAYGIFIGQQVNTFLEKHKGEKPLLVASHGHTIFHRPEAGYTFQLGSGAALFETCKIPVVCDFRSGDVALGGQGAPLVPVGDQLLFPGFEYCLNLGGFANISFEENGKRTAFDICAVNYVLNRLAKRAGKNFDEGGRLAAEGKVLPALLEKLNALSYYKKPAPKSLGREWVEEFIFPLLTEKEKTGDLLRTFSEHAAQQIAACCTQKGKMLVTGGGAHNEFFIQLLREKCIPEIHVPDMRTIDFKEALVFAFLGLLRWENRINILGSVTGAMRDSCGGEIFGGK